MRNLDEQVVTAHTTTAVLNATVVNQGSAIIQLENTVEEQGSTIVRLENTTAAAAASQNVQAAAIETLQTASARLLSSSSSNLCTGFAITTDAALEILVPYLRTCTVMTSLYIRNGVANATLLAEAFQNLRYVAGNIEIYLNPNLTTLDGTFPALQAVFGDLDIWNNQNLITLGSAFASLATVGGSVQIYVNMLLTTIGSSFNSTRSLGASAGLNGRLYFYANGQPDSGSTEGSRSFCASAATALCPTTTNYGLCGYADSAHDCCTAYCATTMDC